MKRLTDNQGNSNYWEKGNKKKEPDSSCSFKVSTYLKISFGLVSRHPHLLTSQGFGSFIPQWKKEKYISLMRQLHAGVAVIVGTGLKEWGQRQPRQACLAGLCSERAHSFMEYLCNCKAGLFTEPVPLSASRSKGCLVFQLGFPSSPDTVCLTRVYSDARGLLAVLVFQEQNSNKHPSCTPLWGCSVPISRQSALSPEQCLAFCVWIDFTDLPPASAPPPDFPLIQLSLMILIFLSEENTGNEIVITLSPFSFPGIKMHTLYFLSSLLRGEWAISTWTTEKTTDPVIGEVIILPPFFHFLYLFFFQFLSVSLAQLGVWKDMLPGEHRNVSWAVKYQSLKRDKKMSREQQIGGFFRVFDSKFLLHPRLLQQPKQFVTWAPQKIHS